MKAPKVVSLLCVIPTWAVSVGAFSPTTTFSLGTHIPKSLTCNQVNNVMNPLCTPVTTTTTTSTSVMITNSIARIRGGSSSLEAVTPATAAAAALALPSLKSILAVTILPTCLGYYRYEYGVSYGYGTATAALAFLTFRTLQTFAAATSSVGWFASLAQIHALAIVFYGVRLNVFLMYREVCLERFRKMRERIEDRQRDKEDGKGMIGKFFNRTPFVLSCAMLYAGLAFPPLISAKLIDMGAIATTAIAENGIWLYQILVGLSWFGFGLGAIGDLTKSFYKNKKGSDHLVTEGVYKIFRHPNYTGEVIGWTSSFVASVVAVLLCTSGSTGVSLLKSMAVPLGLAFFGNIGILFVLCAAAGGLEKRQKEKYGDKKEYKDWVSSSWSGPKLKKKD